MNLFVIETKILVLISPCLYLHYLHWSQVLYLNHLNRLCMWLQYFHTPYFSSCWYELLLFPVPITELCISFIRIGQSCWMPRYMSELVLVDLNFIWQKDFSDLFSRYGCMLQYKISIQLELDSAHSLHFPATTLAITTSCLTRLPLL